MLLTCAPISELPYNVIHGSEIKAKELLNNVHTTFHKMALTQLHLRKIAHSSVHFSKKNAGPLRKKNFVEALKIKQQIFFPMTTKLERGGG